MSMLEETKIKEILLKQNYVSEADLALAEEYGKSHNTSFLDHLFVEDILSPEILSQAIGEFFGVAPIDLKNEKIDEKMVKLLPEIVCRKKGLALLNISGDKAKLVMTNPADLESRNLVAKRVEHQLDVYYINEEGLAQVLAVFETGLEEEVKGLIVKLASAGLSREERDEVAVKVVDTILHYGYQNKSSDIHIEPFANKVVFRFRIDGVMQYHI